MRILNPIRARFLLQRAFLHRQHVQHPSPSRRYSLKQGSDDAPSRSDDAAPKPPPPHVIYVPSSNGVSDAMLTAVIGLGMGQFYLPAL
jgi:hypothetical protein